MTPTQNMSQPDASTSRQVNEFIQPRLTQQYSLKIPHFDAKQSLNNLLNNSDIIITIFTIMMNIIIISIFNK